MLEILEAAGALALLCTAVIGVVGWFLLRFCTVVEWTPEAQPASECGQDTGHKGDRREEVSSAA